VHVVAHADLGEVTDRSEVVAGDMFAGVPSGADCYVLKAIVHDWTGDRAVAILRSCRAAMNQGSRIVIAGAALPD
jgi:hypothetical protein